MCKTQRNDNCHFCVNIGITKDTKNVTKDKGGNEVKQQQKYLISHSIKNVYECNSCCVYCTAVKHYASRTHQSKIFTLTLKQALNTGAVCGPYTTLVIAWFLLSVICNNLAASYPALVSRRLSCYIVKSDRTYSACSSFLSTMERAKHNKSTIIRVHQQITEKRPCQVESLAPGQQGSVWRRITKPFSFHFFKTLHKSCIQNKFSLRFSASDATKN